jgi:hypothetical protein
VPHFENFNPFVDYVPAWPFRRLDEVCRSASHAISAYALDDIKVIADAIEDAITEEKELYVEIETEQYVQRLNERGGWELRYFPGQPEEINEGAIRWLLKNWPSDADEEPDLPDADDLSDADVGAGA